MRPTKRHFMETSAALAHTAEHQPLADCNEYEKMLYLLARHKKDLKGVQSMQQRAEMKKRILPDYLPWIEGALKSANGKQDNVLMTWQIWAIDCNEFNLALAIAEYALHQQLSLPEGFDRTLASAIVEEFADKAKTAKNANQPFELAYLLRVAQLTEHCDMPDQSRARLLREIGLLQQESQPEQALANLEQALALNEGIGVKGEIKKLRKQLNKAESENDAESEKDAQNEVERTSARTSTRTSTNQTE